MGKGWHDDQRRWLLISIPHFDRSISETTNATTRSNLARIKLAFALVGFGERSLRTDRQLNYYLTRVRKRIKPCGFSVAVVLMGFTIVPKSTTTAPLVLSKIGSVGDFRQELGRVVPGG